MRVLAKGNRGPDVIRWQTFLRGKGHYLGKVDGSFGPITHEATKSFQVSVGLMASGIVNDATLGAAVRAGLPLLDIPSDSRCGPDWPPPPTSGSGVYPMSQGGRFHMFGNFKFKPAPTEGNPEAITILGNWVRENIVTVKIRKSATQFRTVQFHKKGAAQLAALFDRWYALGMLDLVKSFDGTWAPRFIRGSRTTLSSHAWGSAFDINARWNCLGCVPALVGQPGSVRELVREANNFGFYWGGHYPHRKDGMHFELGGLING